MTASVLPFKKRSEPPFRVEVDEMYCAPQGEGPNLGRSSLFVRFHGCPLSCNWCDSAFTWDRTHPGYGQQTAYLNLQSMIGAMLSASADVQPVAVVFTGGEPMMYQRHLPEVIDEYGNACREGRLQEIAYEIETSGIIAPSDSLRVRAHFNVSHKLKTAGNEEVPQDRLWNRAALRQFLVGDAIFKPVVGEGDELALEMYLSWLLNVDKAIRDEESIYDEDALLQRVYLMPQAQTREELPEAQARVLEMAQKYGTRVTTRMHIVAYGDERRR
jgi:organic radical activating enzyme